MGPLGLRVDVCPLGDRCRVTPRFLLFVLGFLGTGGLGGQDFVLALGIRSRGAPAPLQFLREFRLRAWGSLHKLGTTIERLFFVCTF